LSDLIMGVLQEAYNGGICPFSWQQLGIFEAFKASRILPLASEIWTT